MHNVPLKLEFSLLTEESTTPFFFFHYSLFKGTYRYFRQVKRVDQVWTNFADYVKQAITDQAKIIDPAVPG